MRAAEDEIGALRFADTAPGEAVLSSTERAEQEAQRAEQEAAARRALEARGVGRRRLARIRPMVRS